MFLVEVPNESEKGRAYGNEGAYGHSLIHTKVKEDEHDWDVASSTGKSTCIGQCYQNEHQKQSDGLHKYILLKRVSILIWSYLFDQVCVSV